MAKRKKPKIGENSKHTPYSKGELNYLIDDLLHPLYATNEGFVLVEGVLHGLVELNPPKSARKFLKYNLPTIVKEAFKRLE